MRRINSPENPDVMVSNSEKLCESGGVASGII
jgi:hypothetical protein